jgi:XTP/dITP diphosphohydrolase/tetrapyrrole methylase family protein/MazG family protein
MQDLLNTVERLRKPDGCPWDREQTHESLVRCLLEESAELIDTIDEKDFDHMREELGDVLLQVVMHAQIAKEEGHFDFSDVAADINAKLIRRHPHVFGNSKADTTEKVLVQWAAIKEEEKKAKKMNGEPQGALKHPPRNLTTLLYADELLKQLAKVNYVPPTLDRERVKDLAAQLTEAEAGRKLLELVAACRAAKVDPEAALRKLARNIENNYEDKSDKPQ